nr:hypothetical protein [Actinokineospora sp.]
MTTPEHDLLAEPVQSDGLAEELKSRGGPSRLTVVLAALALAGVAFVGGILVHSAFGSTPTPAAGARGQNGGPRVPGGYQGGNQGGAPNGGARGAGPGLAATVVRVDGQNLVVKTANGTEMTVKLFDSTKVLTAQPGAVADLTAGSTVQIQGTRGQDGGMSATTVTKQP